MLAVFSSYIAGIVNKKFDVTSLMSKLSGVIFIGLGFNLLMAKIAR